jgi:predicted DNA binding CopG/RHH family protein
LARRPELKGLRQPAESQDARWHDRHKRKLEAAMERRPKEGSALTLRQAVARTKLRPVTIRLATEDIHAARELAAQKSIPYQTYIKMLLREALQRESRGR